MNQPRMPSPAILVAVLAFVAALAGTAIASQTVEIDSRITVAIGCGDQPVPGGGNCFSDVWHGRVKSSKHACEVHRTVKVFKRRIFPEPDELVGEDRSDKHGKWRFKVVPPDHGRFFAKLLRREEGTAGHSFGCDGDRSNTLNHR